MGTVFHVRALARVGSTSDELLRLARDGAPHGTVVTAREQEAGRGRVGRRWDSPPGNLYLSALLRLGLPLARTAELSFVAALAVADAVDCFLPGRARLKWPNDVLVDGAKIAGILVEQTEGFAIVGIGLNVAHCPTRTAYPVTSLAREFHGGLLPLPAPARGGEADLQLARTALLNALGIHLDRWLADGFPPIRAHWLARAHPPGTPLSVGTTEGAFVTIDAHGALLLDAPGGRVRIVGGEVQLR